MAIRNGEARLDRTDEAKSLASHAAKQFPRSILGCALLAGALLLAAGCSDGLPERVTVSGVVLIDGEPLTKGSIQVIPEGDRPAGGSIGSDGSFTLSSYKRNDGVVVGTHRVTIQATKHLSPRETLWMTPKKYGNAGTSGLTITVTEPVDDLKIELTWDGQKPFVERF